MTATKKIELTSAQKASIEKLYRSSRDNTLVHDVAYLAKMKPKAFNDMVDKWQASAGDDPDDEQRILAPQIPLLHRFIKDCHGQRYRADDQVLHAFTAALLYIVNPFDVISDFTPDVGYRDDVYVLKMALGECGVELERYVQSTAATSD